MRIFLEPNESLIFRTGRPFDAGETDYAETLFPPTPETLQGAARALIAGAQNSGAMLSEMFNPTSALVSLIGDRDGYGRFRITHTALARRRRNSMNIEPLYPVPAHLVRDDKEYIRLRPVAPDISSNMPAGMRFLLPGKKPEGTMQPVEGWLTETDLQRVLKADTDLAGLQIIRSADVFLHEPRLGIGMDNASKSARDGMLYSVQMLRMRHDYRSDQGFLYGFLIDIRLTDEKDQKRLLPDDQTRNLLNLRARDQGWVVLGGEQRAASYHIIGQSPPFPQSSHQVAHSGIRSQLYLATPAVLNKGWQPASWPTGVAPIAAAIPRYQSVGGWKLQPGHSGGENKAMQRCVPAGSVYFFDSPVSLLDPLTNYGQEIGYGITIAGEW
ncbi:MAG TPA: type III-B CRISPR module-associated protein Cmr3 [Ktedonobacteraceae bacterium]|nr:type III-B CRISPR module-associated protein Cmr3 [Ktedonobacteraceae bacterium]